MPQVVTFSFCLHGQGLKAIQANPGQQFSTRADTHNMPEYCPGLANPCLHEEISTIFTPSHLANPGRPGSREGCPGLARCERQPGLIVNPGSCKGPLSGGLLYYSSCILKLKLKKNLKSGTSVLHML